MKTPLLDGARVKVILVVIKIHSLEMLQDTVTLEMIILLLVDQLENIIRKVQIIQLLASEQVKALLSIIKKEMCLLGMKPGKTKLVRINST